MFFLQVFDLLVITCCYGLWFLTGDRRFTPWKGSVVDSVVGVFLTQNVSDHLSRYELLHGSMSFT